MQSRSVQSSSPGGRWLGLTKFRVIVHRAAESGLFVLKLTPLPEPYKELGQVLLQMLTGIVREGPMIGTVQPDTPVLLLFDKQRNRYQCWELDSRIKSISLRTEKSESVELKVLNQLPLQIEFWVDTENEIEIEIELHKPE